jgi:hypothetical protein
MEIMLAGVLPSSSSLKLALTPIASGRAEADCNALFAESHGVAFGIEIFSLRNHFRNGLALVP